MPREPTAIEDGRDRLRDIVSFADTLLACTDEREMFRRAVEFARARLGLIRCSIWLRDGAHMRGTYGTSLAGKTTDEYDYRCPMDEMWQRIFDTAEVDPHWQLYPDAQLYEWNGSMPRPCERGWLAATPILKHEQRVAVFTNDAAGSKAACRPELQQQVEIYCALLSHVLVRREVEARARAAQDFAQATLDTLAERVGYYESLIHHSLDIIAVLDADGRIAFVNEAARTALGHAPSDLLGRPVFDYVHPADQTFAAAEIERRFRGSRDDALLVFRVRAADGSWHNVEARGNMLGGPVPRLLVNARDVSDRVRSEHLRAAVQRVSDAALTAPTVDELYAALHRVVGDLMPARNFYIALYDAAAGRISFPYWRDAFDPAPAPKAPGRGYTELVLRRAQTLLVTPDVQAQLAKSGEAGPLGHPPACWLGAPLRAGREVLGVIAVQTYSPEETLGTRDGLALETLAGPISAALASKRHEVAHAVSERSYQTLFSCMPGAFVHLDLMGCKDQDAMVVKVNPGFESLIGIPREQAAGRRLSEILPDHPQPWFAVCARVAASGEPERFEYDAGEPPRRLLVNAYCPCPGHCAFILEDITASHAARIEVQRRDAILEATSYAAERFLGSPDWAGCLPDVLQALGRAAAASRAYVFEARAQGGETPRLYARAEWTAEDAAATPRDRAVGADNLGPQRWIELLARGQTVRGTTKDLPGEERACLSARGTRSILVVPVFVEGRWWGMLGFDDCRRDREWLPQEEGALRSAAQVLATAIQRKSAEERTLILRTALASAANGVVITDREGRIVFVNDALCRLTGYSADEVLGRRPSVLRSGAHDRAFYAGLWQTVLAGRVWRGEITNRRKDGTLYLEDMTITPVRDAAGVVSHFIAIKQDITEQRNLQQQLLQAHKMESVGRLAGGIAHDFNNILQAITGFSSILLGELGEGDPRRADVAEIDRAAQRAVGLTRQLLAFSRKQKMEMAPLRIQTVLQGTEKMMRRLIGEHIRLASDIPPDLPPVRADAGQIEQIIVNLALNARDAMPGGGQLTLSARAVRLDAAGLPAVADARPGDFVRLDVRDTGTGMPPHVRERLFEPFFSTKGPGRGTGLGLAVVYGIVRQHEGFIDVTTSPGKGSTFSIHLPVAAGEAREEDAAGEEDAGEDLAGRGERILVVEDEQGVRDFVSRVLEGHGYQIHVTASLEEARKAFSAPGADFDLLFTDIVLPDGNGIHLADELRAVRPPLRVVLTSAYTEEQSRSDGMRAHGCRFIAKPYTIGRLLRLLRETLS